MTQILRSSRLILRPWDDEDIARWVSLATTEPAAPYFPPALEPAAAERQPWKLREQLDRDGFGWWILAERDGASFTGIISLQRAPYELPFAPAIEVGWRLLPQFAGRGYATEGACAAIAFAFDALACGQVVARTSTLNLPSQRVMQRIGMTSYAGETFDDPRLPVDHPLRKNALYRINASSASTDTRERE